MNEPGTISREKAQELADSFLRERHYNFEKIDFQACEKVESGGQLIYRFSGLLIEKSTAFLDRLARDRSSTTFKFVIDVDSKNGRVLNYYLT